MLCNCPQSTALTDIPCNMCPEGFGQIQKVAFQRLKQGNGTKNSFTDANIKVVANWQTALAAADGTKVVVSPYLYAPTQEGGAARTFGSGNEGLGGIETVLGAEPTSFTAQLREEPQSTIAIMKQLMCEAKNGNLGVYLFDEYGRIECVEDSGTCYPIPVRALFVGDKIHGGLEAPDSNTISWAFLPNYSDGLKIITPTDFNPLTDLCPGE